ncbi:flagellar motor switch protein FliN [Anaerovorax odorimutans]|uniref:flagellar motor switch protein FliN n=1 Tax=Anaerovorax odorimutans TaxID=109327 RepID=UPI0004117894|nr:flagellar motor switch protein FliN [Anaerovorax odorimutans]
MNEEKYADLFSPMEIDAIGEILNISLGSSATAMSDMLDRKVLITTPNVSVVSFEDFDFKSLEPAIGVEITYVQGMEGSNIMLLKRSDVKKILEILMSTEIPDEEFTLDELSLSAVCEVMNQMMGASATALADFIGEPVNISTPVSFEISDTENFKQKYFSTEEPMIVVKFNLDIESSVNSEFMTLMSIDLAKKLIGSVTSLHDATLAETNSEPEIAESAPEEIPNTVGNDSKSMSQEEIMELMKSMEAEAQASNEGAPQQASQPALQQTDTQQVSTPPPTQAPSPAAVQPQVSVQPQIPVQPQAPAAAPSQPAVNMQQQVYNEQPRIINVQPQYTNFDADGNQLTKEQESNLDLIMSVPLEISVEIGRTRKLVKEILEFNQGTLVVLDKMAGEQVDLYVNGQCIAKGDVVVVDDSFGVKITEIIKKSDMLFNK